MFVITEVLISKRLSVTAYNKNGGEMEVKLPEVQHAVDGQLDVRGTSAGGVALSYAGHEPLTFGFKAFALEHSFGLWAIRDLRPGEAMLGDNDGDPNPQQFGDGWLDLRVAGLTEESARTR